MKHTHKCMYCRRVWICNRQGMSYDSKIACYMQGGKHHYSICEKCFKIINIEIPKSIVHKK